jgi:hypothetical protein
LGPDRSTRCSEAQDEYHSYVGGVYRLLAAGATPDELAAHLLSRSFVAWMST